jgi:hypothetical protein
MEPVLSALEEEIVKPPVIGSYVSNVSPKAIVLPER